MANKLMMMIFAGH